MTDAWLTTVLLSVGCGRQEKPRGDLTGDTEKSMTDRHRERRAKKKRQRAHRLAKEERASSRPDGRGKAMKMLEEKSKSSKQLTIIKVCRLSPTREKGRVPPQPAGEGGTLPYQQGGRASPQPAGREGLLNPQGGRASQPAGEGGILPNGGDGGTLPYPWGERDSPTHRPPLPLPAPLPHPLLYSPAACVSVGQSEWQVWSDVVKAFLLSATRWRHSGS